jgi:hypothetical protein
MRKMSREESRARLEDAWSKYAQEATTREESKKDIKNLSIEESRSRMGKMLDKYSQFSMSWGKPKQDTDTPEKKEEEKQVQKSITKYYIDNHGRPGLYTWDPEAGTGSIRTVSGEKQKTDMRPEEMSGMYKEVAVEDFQKAYSDKAKQYHQRRRQPAAYQKNLQRAMPAEYITREGAHMVREGGGYVERNPNDDSLGSKVVGMRAAMRDPHATNLATVVRPGEKNRAAAEKRISSQLDKIQGARDIRQARIASNVAMDEKVMAGNKARLDASVAERVRKRSDPVVQDLERLADNWDRHSAERGEALRKSGYTGPQVASENPYRTEQSAADLAEAAKNKALAIGENMPPVRLRSRGINNDYFDKLRSSVTPSRPSNSVVQAPNTTIVPNNFENITRSTKGGFRRPSTVGNFVLPSAFNYPGRMIYDVGKNIYNTNKHQIFSR